MMYHIHIDIEIESDVIDKFELEGQLKRLSTDSLVEAGYVSSDGTILEESHDSYHVYARGDE